MAFLLSIRKMGSKTYRHDSYNEWRRLFQCKKNNFKAKCVEKVNGVGIDLIKFHPKALENKINLRNINGYQAEDFILICVGELNNNKNQRVLINAVNILKYKIPNLKLLIVGDGINKDRYQSLINKLELNINVNLLGVS